MLSVIDPSSAYTLHKEHYLTDILDRDVGNPRTLNEASYVDGSSMTEESCVSYCNGKNYTYAGVEFSQECCKFQIS
jgi:hypothetical protein